MAANLKPAPLPLTPDLVAKLVGDRPAHGKGIAQLLIEEPGRCRTCGQTRSTPCAYKTCPIVAASPEPTWCAGCGLPDDCCCPEAGDA